MLQIWPVLAPPGLTQWSMLVRRHARWLSKHRGSQEHRQACLFIVIPVIIRLCCCILHIRD